MYYIKYILLLSFNDSKWNFRLMFIFLRYTSVRAKRLIFLDYFWLLFSLIIAYTEPLVKESLDTVFVLSNLCKRFYFKRFIFFLYFTILSKTTICSIFKLSENVFNIKLQLICQLTGDWNFQLRFSTYFNQVRFSIPC